MNEIENVVSEGVHYELVATDNENEQAWDVRLLEGPHPETVIRYGNISFEGEEKDACLKFNFMVQSSPNSELTEEDQDLQMFAADVLEDILLAAASDGSLVYGEPEKSEHKS